MSAFKTVVQSDEGLFMAGPTKKGITRWVTEYPEAAEFESVAAARQALQSIPLTVSLAGVVIIENYGSDHEVLHKPLLRKGNRTVKAKPGV